MEKAFDVRGKAENTDSNTIVDKEKVQHRENLVAYPPTPKDIFKEEPASGEDDDECELVAYSPLPHSDIKEESELGDGREDWKSLA